MADPRVIWVHVREDRRGRTWIAAIPRWRDAVTAKREQGGRLVRYERAAQHRTHVRGFGGR